MTLISATRRLSFACLACYTTKKFNTSSFSRSRFWQSAKRRSGADFPFPQPVALGGFFLKPFVLLCYHFPFHVTIWESGTTREWNGFLELYSWMSFAVKINRCSKPRYDANPNWRFLFQNIQWHNWSLYLPLTFFYSLQVPSFSKGYPGLPLSSHSVPHSKTWNFKRNLNLNIWKAQLFSRKQLSG